MRPSRQFEQQPVVDVVVPVFNQPELTAACLRSVIDVRALQTTVFNLIVIDDASTDSAMRNMLDDLAARGEIVLVRHQHNRGFVASANVGMRLNPTHDVILLNSDTCAFNNWIDRLQKGAYSAPKIGTVTPFSNNAEICSYPLFTKSTDSALELDWSELDSLAAEVNAGATVDLPTGVGFCLYLRRDCLNEVGLFNERIFGRGYGEENDLCQRALSRGWRSVLACDVFVWHSGGASFGVEKQQRIQQVLAVLQQLHPLYLPSVMRFIERDPVLPYREALDIARLARVPATYSMLLVTHSLGGGTRRHVHELTASLMAEGVAVYRLVIGERGPGTAALETDQIVNLPNLPNFCINGELLRLIAVLRQLQIQHVHVHHLVGAGLKGVDLVRKVSLALGVRYDFTAHDYYSICPRVHLIDETQGYCGEPPSSICDGCVARNSTLDGPVNVAVWRREFEGFLHSARRVFAPSEDTARRLRGHFPQVLIQVRPHTFWPRRHHGWLHTSAERESGGMRQIVVLGAIGPHKGSQLLGICARLAASLALPLQFVVVGHTDRDTTLAALPNVVISGAYEEVDLDSLVAPYAGSIAWFPAVWPETYSYTLSYAIEVGLFPVAFDFGALGERIAALGWGAALPLALMHQPRALLAALEAVEIQPRPANILQLLSHEYGMLLRDYYALDNTERGQNRVDDV